MLYSDKFCGFGLAYFAAAKMVETLFEDIFRVEGLNPDGKKFEKGTTSHISSITIYNYSVQFLLNS